MKFGCVLETRVKEKKVERIIRESFKEWSVMTNYDCNPGGRIWVFWRESVCVTPVYKSDQLITCSVRLEDEEEFLCTFVYAKNQSEERKALWDDLCHHHDSAMFKNKEWITMGDFIDILDGEENSRFSSLGRVPGGMRDFQRAVLHCHLSDLGYQGPLFTWSNKQDEGIICKKLDRVLMNDAALKRFSNAYSVFEAGGCSDHMRCRIHLKPSQEKIRRPFKFVNAIGTLPGFLPMFHDFWDSTEVLFHSTSALYRFSKKLKNLKPLIGLGREGIGNLNKRAKEAHELLCEKQKQTLTHPNEIAAQEEAEEYEKWLHVASLEEKFLKQRSKLHWLDVGDQDNKTFYNAIRTRQAHNMIREVRKGDGTTVTDQQEIKQEAERFFSNLLNISPG